MARVQPIASGILEVDSAVSDGLVADVKVYRRGETVLLPEEEVQFTCVLLSGWMTASISLTHGKRQISEIYLKGDLVEPTSEGGRNQELLQAATDLSILRFRLPPLPEAAARWPGFVSWLQDQRHRLRVLDVEHLAALGNCNAVQRMSWLLLRLARRTANGNAGISADFAFPLTQTDLADYLGMTAIHLNRTIRELREANVANVRNGHIVIPDLKRLERQCIII
jgi:CRP-like cAMP-binding protein